MSSNDLATQARHIQHANHVTLKLRINAHVHISVSNIPIPTSSKAVEVPRSAFLPCDRLLNGITCYMHQMTLAIQCISMCVTLLVVIFVTVMIVVNYLYTRNVHVM